MEGWGRIGRPSPPPTVIIMYIIVVYSFIIVFVYSATRGVLNNASAQSAIKCFLSERKHSPRCLQALAI